MKLLTTLAFIATIAGGGVTASAAKLKGTVKVDGSSTVFPITEAVAEEFNRVQPRVRVTVGVSGTGGGFKKFTAGEIDINDASRSIKAKEITLAKKNKVEYLELPVAFDGITVIINNKNTWAKTMTPAELKKIWMPGSKVKKWSDVRKGWPERKIKLFGPGTDSGTFDYFTEAINGKSHVSRSDFTKSEDDNVLVKGVAGNADALGFLGFAYYKENAKKLQAVAIDNGKGPVSPSLKTINNGSYAPLSRPIFIYVSKKSSQKKEVFEFVNFYMTKAKDLVTEVGYVPLPNKDYTAHLNKFKAFSK